MRLITGLLAFLTVLSLMHLQSPEAVGADGCKAWDDLAQDWMLVDCGESASGPGGIHPEVNQYRGPAMLWVRQGLYREGGGYSSEVCQLVPVSEGVPPNFVRTRAKDCDIEGSRPSRADVEQWVRTLAGSLKVPAPQIQLGPEPSVNEWNMAVVGLPVWLWTDTPRSITSTAQGDGMTINIDARLDSLTFAMGDGNTVSCTQWTVYAPKRPGDPSPTCGHVYTKASPPKGEFKVAATANWTARWSAMGYSGTLPLRSTGSRSVPVGELQAVVVRKG